MTAVDDLLAALFEGRDPTLRPDVARWAGDSRRFQTFTATYRDKIRAKLKNARDDGGMRDLRAELEAAALLLRDDRFAVEYEKYAAAKQRGPDFSVTFRTHTPFNVEVRRFRADPDEEAATRAARLSAALCDKVGQMPPGMANLLWLAAEGELSEADLNDTATALRRAAERKEDDFFVRRGFAGASDFLRQYARLGGVVLPRPGEFGVWLNPLARHKPPPAVVTAIRRLDAS